VLAVLSGGVSNAEAARKEKVFHPGRDRAGLGSSLSVQTFGLDLILDGLERAVDATGPERSRRDLERTGSRRGWLDPHHRARVHASVGVI
jgi:hypothetical protein